MKKLIILILAATFTVTAACASMNANEARVQAVQKEDNYSNLDAFEKNYQENFESITKKTSMSPIEQMFNGKEERVTGTPIRQAGYDLFTSSTSIS